MDFSTIFLKQDRFTGTEQNVRRRLQSLFPTNRSLQYASLLDGRDVEDSVISPLFQGMGTHYSFLYVGTPAQRVSVIVDTGSHHTAFPCVGCNCGKHMDPYFDPRKSSTAKIRTCNRNQKCTFKQSYSEGSSWQAFKVNDKVWIGGEHIDEHPTAAKLAINFDFGCQSLETGLFRTQNVDGIMGFSGMADTLPHQLASQNVIKTKVFTMCFRIGGGILTLGGIDNRIHASAAPPSYAMLTKSSGWFTVKLTDVLLRDPKTRQLKSIGEPASKYNTGKGAIVDSGTTDTYLPSSVRAAFERVFASIGGLKYSNSKMLLTATQYQQLPTIVYRLVGKNSEYIDVECPPSSYAEQLKNDKDSNSQSPYAFRIYLTEGAGSVLGANFMNGYNVIFDMQGMQIGFAKSECGDYAEARKVSSNSPPSRQQGQGSSDILPSQITSNFRNFSNASKCLLQVCDASCDIPRKDSYLDHKQSWKDLVVIRRVSGRQQWKLSQPVHQLPHEMGVDEISIYENNCSISCTNGGYFGPSYLDNGFCLKSAWSPCTTQCVQSRLIFANEDFNCTHGVVEYRPCSVYQCPLQLNDFIVSSGLHIQRESSALWSAYSADELVEALCVALQVQRGSIHLQSGSYNRNSGLSVHLKIRIAGENFNLTSRQKAVAVIATLRNRDFANVVTATILTLFPNSIGWLRHGDMLVKSVSLSKYGDSGIKSISFDSGGVVLREMLNISVFKNPQFISAPIFWQWTIVVVVGCALVMCILLFLLYQVSGSRPPTSSREKVLHHMKSTPKPMKMVY